ncbi:MAG: type II CRISPR RNA-guided endonuclease Cas9, partial [Mycoplasmataceae bacterium]|nr:type II CRISPR RNA-guided endonuclease Cas9 [Mycoplasmataceae bacterium]
MEQENKKKKISIGLDLGVASCGWAVFDSTDNDNKKLIDLGVRLFEEAANDDKQTHASLRGDKRRARRRLRRIKFKKNSLVHLFAKSNLVNGNSFEEKIEKVRNIIDNGLFDENGTFIQPIDLRLKALVDNEQLSNEELMIVLFNYFSHRGYFYVNDDDKKDKKTKKSDKDKLDQNNKKLDDTKLDKHENTDYEEVENALNTQLSFNDFPTIKYYKKNKEDFNKFIGIEENNKISNSYWKIEVEYLLNHQNKIKDNKKFINDYLNIFTYIRKFNEGPGNEHSPTPYGLYREKDGKIVKIGDNLWDATIGKCSVFENENRGMINSPLAEITNLVNDLINLSFHSDKKQKLFDEIKLLEFFNILNESWKKDKPYAITEANLKKIFKELFPKEEIIFDKNHVYGYRFKNKGKEPKFTELTNTYAIIKTLIKTKIINIDEINLLDKNFVTKINDFYKELVKFPQDKIKRFEKFLELIKNKNNELDKEELYKLFDKITGFNKTSSISYKAMFEFLHYITNKNNNELVNSTTFFYNNIKKNREKNYNLNGWYLPKNLFKDEILSVNAKRTFLQAIKVINQIIHLYKNEYDLQDVIIEMAREKNSKEQKKFIEKLQKDNEAFKNKCINEYKLTNKQLKNGQLFLKLLLWTQQDHMDLYDGKEIDFKHLINKPQDFQIDHIIPYSWCGIDSLNNKVLTTAENNRDKKERTPYQWLRLEGEGKFENFKQRIDTLYNKSKINAKLKDNDNKKQDLLLTEEKHFNLVYEGKDWEDFINRNLNDTRYSTRLLLNTLQDFFEANKPIKLNDNDLIQISDYDEKETFFKDAKVKVLNGTLTKYARNNIFINKNDETGEIIPLIKDRNKSNNHHAIDAAVICVVGSYSKLNRLLSDIKQKEQDIWLDFAKKISSKNIDKDSEEYNELKAQYSSNISNLKENELEKDWLIQKSKYIKDLAIQLNEISNNENKDLFVKFSFPLMKKSNGELFNETNYGLTKSNNENIITSKIDLLNDKNIDNKYFEDHWFNTHDKNAGKCSEDLLIKYSDFNKKEINPIYTKLSYIFYKPEFQKIGKNDKKSTNPYINYLSYLNNEDTLSLIKDKTIQNIIQKKLYIPIWKNDNFNNRPTLIRKLKCKENFTDYFWTQSGIKQS